MAYLNRTEIDSTYPPETVYGYIYLWTNKINNRQYVGQTINLDLREYQHIYYDKAVIDKAISKYGEENFERIIVDVAFSCEELNKKEIEYIKKFDTYNNGYNVTIGGNSLSGYRHTEESKRKMSQAHKGKKISDKQKQLLSEKNSGKGNPMYDVHLYGEENPFYGHNHSNETITKLKSYWTEEKRSEQSKKMTENNPMKNKNTAKKVSEALKGKMVKENNPNFGNYKTLKEKIIEVKRNGGTPFVATNKKTKNKSYFYSTKECVDSFLNEGIRISTGEISTCLNGKRKSAKQHIFERITWEEYEQYLTNHSLTI